MGIYICQHVYSSDVFEYLAESRKFVGWKSKLGSHLVHSRLYDDSSMAGFLMISARTQAAMMFCLIDQYIMTPPKVMCWEYRPLKIKRPNHIYHTDYIDVSGELSKLSVTIHNDVV